jgi:ribosome biogenesis GTPase A
VAVVAPPLADPTKKATIVVICCSCGLHIALLTIWFLYEVFNIFRWTQNFKSQESMLCPAQVIGLDNAGKSTIVNHFKGESGLPTAPTMGFELTKVLLINLIIT